MECRFRPNASIASSQKYNVLAEKDFAKRRMSTTKIGQLLSFLESKEGAKGRYVLKLHGLQDSHTDNNGAVWNDLKDLTCHEKHVPRRTLKALSIQVEKTTLPMEENLTVPDPTRDLTITSHPSPISGSQS